VPEVSIRPMTEQEFQAFLHQDVYDYAQEKVAAGNWTAEEALPRSRDEHENLLPVGLSTPHHHLYTIELDGLKVGRVWLSSDPRTAGGSGFLYDLFVEEAFRRRGIARQAMLLVELEARRQGLSSLALHVFGHNLAARALYEDLGYAITNLNMSKPLSAI
jgi:ribosomal protein S18 acetylase RimI-like enzyme